MCMTIPWIQFNSTRPAEMRGDSFTFDNSLESDHCMMCFEVTIPNVPHQSKPLHTEHADGTQLYFTFIHRDKFDQNWAIAKIEICIVNIKVWMTFKFNFQKLNESKTEIVFIIKMKYIDQHVPSVKIEDVAIEASSTAKDVV